MDVRIAAGTGTARKRRNGAIRQLPARRPYPDKTGKGDKAKMNSWMQRLSQHYDRMRRHYPDDELMILFDIDGTILDSRT
jgi:hypothetical protein